MVFAIITSSTTWAQPDPTAGEQKAQSCIVCHGPDGNAAITMYPKLAGQHASYLLFHLNGYRAGANGVTDPAIVTRTSATAQVMYAQVKDLTDQDIVDLVAYFSAQKMTDGATDPQYLKQGEQLYRGGDLARGIPACAACHDPQGSGNGPAKYPRLSGQNVDYMVAQLKAYQSGESKKALMRLIAQKLTEEDIVAVSQYASGLH
jgi:cytochrome c553